MNPYPLVGLNHFTVPVAISSSRRTCAAIRARPEALSTETVPAGIGSGVAEGACRHLVKDRMERTGMRWRVPSAQAMLELRAVHASDLWDEFQDFRIAAENRRLHPYKEFVDELASKAA